MKHILKVVALILAATMLQGCSEGMNKQSTGTLIGGVAGGLIGSRFGKGGGALLATGAGALAGALIGGQIGKNMDEQDKKLAELTSQRALENAPTGNSIQWRNPDNGHYGTITPTKTLPGNGGQPCREFTQTVVIGGKPEKAYGTACRQGDGSWKIVQN